LLLYDNVRSHFAGHFLVADEIALLDVHAATGLALVRLRSKVGAHVVQGVLRLREFFPAHQALVVLIWSARGFVKNE